ncbi:MAG: hypothetical protein Q4D93_00405 [Porphyromonas sp.]|nr:hypothetical protein [Porphyromonas sp.]
MKEASNADKERRKQALMIVGGIVLLLLIGAGAYLILNQREQISEMQQLAELEKQMLTEEYNELSLQYEGYKFEVSNDSLAYQLASEQAKVQRLMEELQTVKSTNARRIAELRRELDTLRSILKSYVVQIDSLNAANEQLRAENQQVRQEISRVSSERSQLRREKERLTEQVELAAKLTVSGFRQRGLNSRGRETNRIRNMRQLEFTFQLDQNVTAEPGFKEIYMRIIKPDDTLLSQPAISGTMPFEGGQVPYSISRQVEYAGEAIPVTMYWDIEEFLVEGTYRVELFADGYLIGRQSFTL